MPTKRPDETGPEAMREIVRRLRANEISENYAYSRIAAAVRKEREAALEEAACVAGENGDGDSARAIRSLKSPQAEKKDIG